MGGGDEAPPSEGDVPRDVTLTGRVQWSDLEGGAYVLETEEGDQYDLHDMEGRLPAGAERPDFPGLLVRVEGVLYEDIADIHMVGPVVQVTELEVLWGEEDPL